MTIYVSHLFEDEKIKEVIDKYKNEFEIGIETIDFAAGCYLDMKDEKIQEYSERMGGYIRNHPLSIHGPFLDLCPHSYDSLIRKATMERYEETYRAAYKLKAKHLIFHSCQIPSIYFGSTWEDNSIEFWKEFLEDKDDSVKIHIENVFDDKYDNMLNLIDRINNPLLSICLDIGHANCYSKQPVFEWIKSLGKRIGHIHLHNNYGDKDSHLPLIEGSINVNEILYLLTKERPDLEYTIEMNSPEDFENSIETIKKFL